MSTDQGDMLGLVKSREALDVAPVVLAGLLLDPETGEAVSVADAEDELLGLALSRIRDADRELKIAKRELSDELIKRMDASASYTRYAGDWVLSTDSREAAARYDPESLREALRLLCADGLIGWEAVDAAVVQVAALKVQKRAVSNLIALGGPVADAVKACRVDPSPRYVDVKRA